MAGLLCTAVSVLAAPCAYAAPARLNFRIAPKPYSESLIDLALQADISLLGAAACRGMGPGLAGRMSVEQALVKLLADADCNWRMPAACVVQITPRARTEAPIATAPVSEVLVTATKRVENADKLAASVSTLSRESLAKTGSVDPSDTAGQLSGLLTTDLGPARDKLLLRGLSDGAFTGRSRSTVGTYLDDAPLNYNAPDPDLRLIDVERVEVVRGPQGALYGGGSLSGVYRIVSRKPDLYDHSLEARVTGSATLKGAPSHAAELIANAPIFEGRLALRAAAYTEVQGGYLDDLASGEKNVDRTERYGGRLAAAFAPNETWSLTISAAAQHLASDDTHYTLRGLKLDRFRRIAEPHENAFSLASATLRGSFDWADVSASTGYVQHRYASTYDASSVITQFSDERSGVGLYDESTRTHMAVQDLVFTSRGAGPVAWLLGAYAARTTETSPSRMLSGDGSTLFPFVQAYLDDRRDRIEDLAVYGEARFEFADGWTAAAGGRFFQTDVRTRSRLRAEKFGGRDLDITTRTRAFSPKLTLQRELASGDILYGVISEGHRAGGVNTGAFQLLPPGREAYGPDQLTNFELGAKFKLLGRSLAVNAAAFYDVWENIQTDQFQFKPSGIPYTANVGDAAIMGLEAEATYTRGGLALQANMLAARIDILKANPDFAPQLSKGLPNAPPISFGLVGSYERPLGRRLAWRVTGAASYVGISRVTFDPDLSSKMGDYVRMKLIAALIGPRWAAELFVTNPLDQVSNTFAFGNPFTFAQSEQATPQRPLTVGVTLTARR